MFIIAKQGKVEIAETWGEMCGDYHINHDGMEYVEGVVKKKFAEITEYKFRAKSFKTRQAAEKALNLIYNFSSDPEKTLKNMGFEILEIE